MSSHLEAVTSVVSENVPHMANVSRGMIDRGVTEVAGCVSKELLSSDLLGLRKASLSRYDDNDEERGSGDEGVGSGLESKS